MTKLNWLEIGRASTDLVSHIVANSELLGRSIARDFAQVRRDAVGAYDATLGDLREIGATFRASPRYLRLATLAARIAARHRFAVVRGERLGIDAVSAAHQQSAADVLAACVELGGGVLKVGQLLSARADLLPAAYIDALATLQDRAPAQPFEDIDPIIAEDLGDRRAQLLDIEPEAIAAASLAQVHSARLADGREVVIKVRRPGVDALVAADLRALSMIGNMLGESLPGVDVATTVREVSRFLADELDFDLEARRLEAFAAMAATDARWHVPAIVPELCGPRVIVMERIRGSSLGEHLAAADDDERARVIALIIELLASQVLGHGLAHGDPHPGNVMVDEAGRVVFVDFGCVLELEPDAKRAYVTLVMAILARDAGTIAEALSLAGFDADNDEALVSMASLFLEAFEDGMLAELDPAEQAKRALELAREAGDVRVPASFVLIARIFALVGGLVIHYRPTLELGPLLAKSLTTSTPRSSVGSMVGPLHQTG